MKFDEKTFLILVFENLYDKKGIFPRDLINQNGFELHYKRAWYLLKKWCKKGWYEYGTCLDLGWLTEVGKKEAENLLEQENK